MSEFDGRSHGNAATMHNKSSQDGAGDHAFGGGPGVGAGTLLRQAREAAGLHIAALAVSLKVPVKKLEALEADRWDLLPDAVFVRALAASVCRTLKMDATHVLALLPQTGKPQLGAQITSINTPFRSPGDGPGPSLWAQMSRPAVLAGLLLLFGALVLFLLPAVQRQDNADQPASEPVSGAVLGSSQLAQAMRLMPSGVALANAEVVGSANSVTPGPGRLPESVAAAIALPAAPVLVPNLPSPINLAVAAPGPAGPGLLAAVPAVPVSPPPLAQPTPAGIIVFKATGESWVEVTDAKGIVVLRRTLAAGEVVGASGALPLAAVVGRVDATQVQVRGQAFDLNAVGKDNVARFEVK